MSTAGNTSELLKLLKEHEKIEFLKAAVMFSVSRSPSLSAYGQKFESMSVDHPHYQPTVRSLNQCQ